MEDSMPFRPKLIEFNFFGRFRFFRPKIDENRCADCCCPGLENRINFCYGIFGVVEGTKIEDVYIEVYFS